MLSQNPIESVPLEVIENRDEIGSIGKNDQFRLVGFGQGRAALDEIESGVLQALNPDYISQYTEPLRYALFPDSFEGGVNGVEVIIIGQNRASKVGYIAVPRAVLIVSGDLTSTGRGKIGEFSSTVAYADRNKRTLATQDNFMRAVRNTNQALSSVAQLRSLSSKAY